jgi:hypothetical protein
MSLQTAAIVLEAATCLSLPSLPYKTFDVTSESLCFSKARLLNEFCIREAAWSTRINVMHRRPSVFNNPQE